MYFQEALLKIVKTSKSHSDAIGSLLVKLFSTEELTVSSVMGVQNSKGKNKPALDFKRRMLIEGIILLRT